MADGVAVFRHEAQIIPVVAFPASRPHAACPIIVFREGGMRVGIAALEIGDVIEGDFALEFVGRSAGVLGVVNIGGSPVEVVDPFHVIDLGPRGSPALPPFESRPAVILVEPAVVASEIVSRALRSWGCRVTAFKDHVALREGLRQGGEFAACFIPANGDGSQNALIHTLRESAASRRAPIYGLTSDAAMTARGAGRRGGLAGSVDRFDRAAIHAAMTAALAAAISGAAAA